MKKHPPTLEAATTRQIRAWLAAVTRRLGAECSTARIYRAELRRRAAEKGVRNGK